MTKTMKYNLKTIKKAIKKYWNHTGRVLDIEAQIEGFEKELRRMIRRKQKAYKSLGGPGVFLQEIRLLKEILGE